MSSNASAPPPFAIERPKNRLLRALPEEDFLRLRPDLKNIPAPKRHVFHKHGEAIEFVYFPNGGVASLTAVLSDGTMVETATIGVEGMVGIDAYMTRNPTAGGEAMMQVPDGSVEKLSLEAFQRERDRQGAFSILMGRYAQITVAQITQSVACNARHHIQERCPRWLLQTRDRVERDEFELSHEFLAMMLGVRRQSVTVVAGMLQSAGLITYKHGVIRILDGDGLEAASCECYGLVKRQFDELGDVSVR